MKKIVAGILLVIAVFFFYKGVYQYFQGNESNNWPSVQGTILISEWKTTAGGKHKAHIEYEYYLDNTLYKSDFIHFAQFNSTNLAYKFKKGEEVSVYYNPKKPAEAVLIPGASNLSILIFMGMGALFLISSIVTLFLKMPISG